MEYKFCHAWQKHKKKISLNRNVIAENNIICKYSTSMVV